MGDPKSYQDPTDVQRFTSCTTAGPMFVDVKDGKIVRVDPISFQEEEVDSWEVGVNGKDVSAALDASTPSVGTGVQGHAVYRDTRQISHEAQGLGSRWRAKPTEPWHHRIRAHQLG